MDRPNPNDRLLEEDAFEDVRGVNFPVCGAEAPPEMKGGIVFDAHDWLPCLRPRGHSGDHSVWHVDGFELARWPSAPGDRRESPLARPLGLKTRVAFVKETAEAEGVTLADDVALYLAGKTALNLRELEGALIRLVTYTSLTGQDISLPFAQEVLSRVYGEPRPA